jgi:ketosteroid isomerase-like protein
MPWFPEFSSAVELARVQTRAAGQADPVGQYFTALNNGDTRALEDVWPGEVGIYDPRAGEIRGHKQLRRFVGENRSWMAEPHVRTDIVAATCADGRAVVELLAHLEQDGQDLVWPVAVPQRSVCGVPHLLLPMAGGRTTPRQAPHTRTREGQPGGCRRPLPHRARRR